MVEMEKIGEHDGLVLSLFFIEIIHSTTHRIFLSSFSFYIILRTKGTFAVISNKTNCRDGGDRWASLFSFIQMDLNTHHSPIFFLLSFKIEGMKVPFAVIWTRRIIDMEEDIGECYRWSFSLFSFHSITWHHSPIPFDCLAKQIEPFAVIWIRWILEMEEE